MRKWRDLRILMPINPTIKESLMRASVPMIGFTRYVRQWRRSALSLNVSFPSMLPSLCRTGSRPLSAHSYLHSIPIVSFVTLRSNPRRTASHSPLGNPAGISATTASNACSTMLPISSNTPAT